MCQAGESGANIALYLGINENVLYRKCKEDNNQDFSEFKRQNQAKGNVLLKTKQFEKAMKGDTSMLIFLGKNRLGQSDKVQQEQTNYNVDVTEEEIKDINKTLEDEY